MNTFFLIVLGQIISLFGNAALRFALPLYLLRQTGSAALYGGITALAMLPALAGMLTGGALADRCRKARLMALLDLVTAGISAAAAAGLPHLPLLPLILTVLGSLYAIQGLYQPVVRACLPLLLNGTQLLRGNAVIQLVDTVDELLGPLLGAVLLEHLGIRGLLVLCGCCFALSAGMELCLCIPQDVPRDTKLSVRSLWTDLRESARFLTGVVMSSVSNDINVVASRYDGKKTMHYCLLVFLVGPLTLGIGYIVWNHKLCNRIGAELQRRGIAYSFGARDYWLWNVLGALILVGPFVFLHKLFNAVNLMNADYNVKG